MVESGDGTERGGEGKATSDDAREPIQLKIVGGGEALKHAIEVAAKGAEPAPAGAASSPAKASPAGSGDGSGSADGQCCDAYPAATLTAALGTAVDPKELWAEVLKGDDHAKLATSLTKEAAAARIDLLKKSAWATAPEMVLLEACESGDRPALAKKMLELRAGATESDSKTRAAQAGLAEERTSTARVAREMLEEAKTQMQTWRSLVGLGKLLLIIASAFSAAMILLVVILAGRGDLGEVETPIIIFALAVFAISPAVLLLRERPLEGLDKWSPSGPDKKEEKPADDSKGGKGGKDSSTSGGTEAPA